MSKIQLKDELNLFTGKELAILCRGIETSSYGTKQSRKNRLMKKGDLKQLAKRVATLKFLSSSYICNDEFREILEANDLAKYGAKEVMIERLVNNDVTIKSILKNLPASTIKENYKWIFDTEKSPLVHEAKEELADFFKVKVTKSSKKQTKKKKFSKGGTTGLFKEVVKAIEQWMPRNMYSYEDGFKADLDGRLRHINNLETLQETGETKADILVQGKIPIEMKKGIRQNEFDRLFGQIIRNIDMYNCCVAVICNPKKPEKVEKFRERINTYLKGKNVVVIAKYH